MFGLLRGAVGFGLGGQGPEFGQTQAAGAFGLGAQQQELGQLSGIQQQGFGNQLASNQQRFGQLGDLARLGQASAAGTAQQGLASAGQVGGLLTGIGNVQAAERIGRANLASQTAENLITVNSQNMDLFGNLAGGFMGGG